MSEDIKKRSWFWTWRSLLLIPPIYIVLFFLEQGAISLIDRRVMSDRAIFTDYVARLKAPVLLKKEEGFCEIHRVALAYKYEICVETILILEECGRPSFTVRYHSPMSHLSPLSADYSDRRMLWTTSILEIRADKSVCYDYQSNGGN